MEEERRLAYVGITRQKKRLIYHLMKEPIILMEFHQDLLKFRWKCRVDIYKTDEFEFNQDNSIEFDQGGTGIKRTNA